MEISLSSEKATGYGMRIKDTASLANKFVTRAGAASGDYKDGVAASGGDWLANTVASEANYEQGVNAAIARKGFGKGVQQAGQQKFITNATTLGASRYGPGVANAKDAWGRGVQPYLDELKSMELPPKGPRGSAQNQARANAVAVRLGAKRVNM